MAMDSRREFLKKAALLAAGGAYAGAIPASISRALAIDPAPGSTFLDAEHVVILMQENRSFDHCYGTLRGVRGFADPRAVTLPDGNPVWYQTDAEGETYGPFRLNIKDTNATWIGSLPHDWLDQSRARNEGRHDQWLVQKRSGHKGCGRFPLTLGYYNREDVPFYYSLADAFTICDQNFCSSLTGTTPNRLHLWTGTIRDKASPLAKACVRNGDADFNTTVSWRTFPEILEQEGISWGVYQNEVSVPTGLSEEEDGWLTSFGDNPLEYFTQYGVLFAPRRRKYLEELVRALPPYIARLEATPQPWSEAVTKQVRSRRAQLESAKQELAVWTEEARAKLPPAQQNLQRKAFVTNERDPHFRELSEVRYRDGSVERRMRVPKGDVFHQLREDVRTGKLPAVSWIVAPENFSDHPSAPWYGAWYVSETLDILTQNPEVWKKTIFILCYDENDGYFDHVPPFTPPYPGRPETGKVSAGLDVALEHVRMEQETNDGRTGNRAHAGPIGLGYRVPLVVASPWSRGGYVCSQVFDHTSVLQFLEKLLSHRTGKPIRETNISAWRRAVCGDLTSVFRPYRGENIELPKPVERDPFLESIHQAQFKPFPSGFQKLGAADLQLVRKTPEKFAGRPTQEKGVRPACALPYELSADGTLGGDGKSVVLSFAAGREIFGDRAAGAPFHVYAPGKMRVAGGTEFGPGRARSYAVSAGDRLEDAWTLSEFPEGAYHLCVHGPNGFFRELRGGADDPAVEMTLRPSRAGDGGVTVRFVNRDAARTFTVRMEDASYGAGERTVALEKDGRVEVFLEPGRSRGWYDLQIRIEGASRFARRYAGRIETGKEGVTDPVMGGDIGMMA